MTALQMYLTFGVFAGVILAIACNVHRHDPGDAPGREYLDWRGGLHAGGHAPHPPDGGRPLALLFGGMVVARILATTGMFARVGRWFVRATIGSWQTIPARTARPGCPPVCRVAQWTVVMLLAPIVIQVAQALQFDSSARWCGPPSSATPRAGSPWWAIPRRFWWAARSA